MKHIATVAALTALTSLAHASLLTNGSFEQPGSTAWNHFTNGQVPGWKTDGGEVIEIGKPIVYGVTGADGSNVAELDSTSNIALSQTVQLTAGHYDFSFLFAKRGVNLEGRPTNTCDFDVLWNHVLIGSVSPTSSTFQEMHFLVTAATGTNTVTFHGTGASDGMGALIDRADLQAVPEPVSLLALAPLVGAMAKRKDKFRK